MKFSKNFIAKIATIKDAVNPVINIEYCEKLKEKLLLTRSRDVAASMVGIARRNENSTAVFLFVPKNSAGIIVAADLETPGIIEKDWRIPIKKAFLEDIFSMLST